MWINYVKTMKIPNITNTYFSIDNIILGMIRLKTQNHIKQTKFK